ncbi:MAG: DUF1028 domain-containing protein [Calditrichia bacterium]
MKYIVSILLASLFVSQPIFSQDTFSIVAVDTITGEVGSAGASCVAGSIILSDVHPGVGVVHTQSFYLSSNQQYGRQLMNQGFPPQQIVDSLVANDAQNNPTRRQYGVVDLIDNGRSAAYTGVNCFDWKGQTLGQTYAIQGNILSGPEVLDSMETRFLATSGDLAEKLMAALQGANFAGADVRCLGAGTSSISAFIRVAKPNDMPGKFHLDLNVNSTATGVEPIDSLQVLFNSWRGPTGVEPVATRQIETFQLEQNYPNPFNPETTIRYQLNRRSNISLKVFTLLGQEVATLVAEQQTVGSYSVKWDGTTYEGNAAAGVYLYRLRVGTEAVTRQMILAK